MLMHIKIFYVISSLIFEKLPGVEQVYEIRTYSNVQRGYEPQGFFNITC